MHNFHFFWGGPFSQWHHSPFNHASMKFNSCEQWMMYHKAMMFNDTNTAKAIMVSQNPAEQKKFGRKVKNFDDNKWMKEAYNIVVEGNRAKFQQNSELFEVLRGTSGKLLVEASPYDRRWGIGMAKDDPGIEDPANWRGDNLLGKAITQVRLELIGR